MKILKTQEWIAVGVALVVVVALFFGSTIRNAIFGARATSATGATAVPTNTANSATTSQTTIMQNISTTKGLEIYDVQVGTGAEAKTGQTVTAHYVGFLTDGTKFDSSVDRGQPFSFALGGSQVIRGWDMGIVGMKVGGVRRLVISSEFAYGARAVGPIPANSTLIFEVQLLDVK